MTRIRVPLGKFIKEYSERNKGNEDIPVYSVTSADFGRLFSTTRYGSSISDSFLLYQSKIAARMLSNMTSMKLINVSYKVIPI